MSHDKLNEADEGFLDLPQGAVQVSAGVNGTESFLERGPHRHSAPGDLHRGRRRSGRGPRSTR